MGFLEKGSEEGSGVKARGSETDATDGERHGCQVCRLSGEPLHGALILPRVVASHQPFKRWDWPFPASVWFCFGFFFGIGT